MNKSPSTYFVYDKKINHTYHRNNQKSHFLFYLEYFHIACPTIHIKDLIKNYAYKFSLYILCEECLIDCEQFKDFLFSCGGFYFGTLIACIAIRLSSLGFRAS